MVLVSSSLSELVSHMFVGDAGLSFLIPTCVLNRVFILFVFVCFICLFFLNLPMFVLLLVCVLRHGGSELGPYRILLG